MIINVQLFLFTEEEEEEGDETIRTLRTKKIRSSSKKDLASAVSECVKKIIHEGRISKIRSHSGSIWVTPVRKMLPSSLKSAENEVLKDLIKKELAQLELNN